MGRRFKQKETLFDPILQLQRAKLQERGAVPEEGGWWKLPSGARLNEEEAFRWLEQQERQEGAQTS